MSLHLSQQNGISPGTNPTKHQRTQQINVPVPNYKLKIMKIYQFLFKGLQHIFYYKKDIVKVKR